MIDGHNQFRKLVIDQYVPRQKGQPTLPPLAGVAMVQVNFHLGRQMELNFSKLPELKILTEKKKKINNHRNKKNQKIFGLESILVQMCQCG